MLQQPKKEDAPACGGQGRQMTSDAAIRADDLGLSGSDHLCDVWNANEVGVFDSGPMTVNVASLIRLARR